MPRRAHAPNHPGEVLDKEFLEPHALTSSRVARDLKITPQRVRKIVRGASPISAEIALRLARYFGTSDEFWMALQVHYDLAVERGRLGKRLRKEVAVLHDVG
jgi:addiction module HigA family antidote